jgi:hypothetical protein
MQNQLFDVNRSNLITEDLLSIYPSKKMGKQPMGFVNPFEKRTSLFSVLCLPRRSPASAGRRRVLDTSVHALCQLIIILGLSFFTPLAASPGIYRAFFLQCSHGGPI